MKHLSISGLLEKTGSATLLLLFFVQNIGAQADTSWLRRVAPSATDSVPGKMNMDAVYDRPFLQMGKMPVALGGYVEANTAYFSEDGITEGLSFQLPRLTLFMSSTIARRIKFLTEIEFEEGGREINIEFASLDIQFHPVLNLRGGVVMNPIGAFNQNHDGPKWDFVSRPVSATRLLPATWSNAGFGLYGKWHTNDWTIGYEAYLTNGFDASIISNTENRTFLPATKDNPERFEESFNGQPLYTGKLSVRHRSIGEIGLSYMGGVYNKFEEDGLTLDRKRSLHTFAIDINATVPRLGTKLLGEWAWVTLDVPDTYSQQFGNRQQGGFLDIVQPMLRRSILGWDRAVLSVVCRLEYVDWNVGTFRETGGEIADDFRAIVPGISFRPTAQTILRLNYRYEWQRDILGNPPKRTAGWQFGVSAYF
ncbi:MAG: hypothetical protein ABMA02_14710 [Saprospiraceae bacterium]